MGLPIVELPVEFNGSTGLPGGEPVCRCYPQKSYGAEPKFDAWALYHRCVNIQGGARGGNALA